MDATFTALNSGPRQFSQRVFAPRASASPYLWTLRLLCAVALGVTGYLSYVALMAGEVAGCSGGEVFDCGHVLTSRWSKLFHWPVSVPAFALYAALFVALAVCRSTTPRTRRSSIAWSVVTVGSIAAGLAALWFIGLQIFAIRHLCIYCLVAHACGIALCAAILWKRPLGAKATAALSMLSIIGVSSLIGGQVFAKPPETFKIERFAEVPAMEAAPASTFDAPDATNKPEKTAEVEIFEPF
jgi:uncharacterized membrane protein